MSLALTALRLQAIAALNSHPTLATLCEGRIYDSRIDEFDHGEPVPAIVVTTEDVEGEGISDSDCGPPFRDRVNLVLEVAYKARAEFTIDGQTQDVIVSVETDGNQEANLNLIAYCAEMMLGLGLIHPLGRPTAAGALLREAVCSEIERRSIARFSGDQSGIRLATHLITLACILKDEAGIDARHPPTGPYAVLPGPLRLVCEASEPGSPERATCDRLAGLLPTPTLNHLRRATFATPLDAPDLPGALPIAADFPTLEPPAESPFDEEFPHDGAEVDHPDESGGLDP